MERVAHMSAHKALDIDNFNDAAVKVGMYKAPVTAFMHPYTLGALETRLRKMGWTRQTAGGFLSDSPDLSYNGITLAAREYWSKDDVTFATDEAAALRDATNRGVVQFYDIIHHIEDGLTEALLRTAPQEIDEDSLAAIKKTAIAQVDEILAVVKAALVMDVTGELECAKTKKISSDGKTVLVRKPGDATFERYSSWFSRTLSPLHGEVCKAVTKWHEAAKEHHDDPEQYVMRELLILATGIKHGHIDTVSMAAQWARLAIRDMKLTSRSGDMLMDAADKLVDAVKDFEAQAKLSQAATDLVVSTARMAAVAAGPAGHQDVTEGAKLVGQEIVKALDRQAAKDQVTVAVLPGLNLAGMPEKALSLQRELESAGINAVYDARGSTAQRIRRYADLGTPYLIIVDTETVERGTFTLRPKVGEPSSRVTLKEAVAMIKEQRQAVNVSVAPEADRKEFGQYLAKVLNENKSTGKRY